MAPIVNVIDCAVSEFGRLDCLLNNAGAPDAGHGIAEMTVEEFDDVLALMLRGPMLGMKHAAPIMRRQGCGSIINTGSVAGHRPDFSGNIYAVATGGLSHLTRCVAIELDQGQLSVTWRHDHRHLRQGLRSR